jgi:Fe-S-cluster containining protein
MTPTLPSSDGPLPIGKLPGASATPEDTDIREQLREMFHRTKERQSANTRAAMDRTTDPKRLAENVVSDAYRLLQNLLTESPARKLHECGSGCSWCCHQPVRVSAPEAIAIADALREAYPPDWLTTIRTMIAQRVAIITRLGSLASYTQQRLPCAFLAPTGDCSIYAWRPYVCRGHHSMSRVACQEAYVEDVLPKTFDLFTNTAANAVLNGTTNAIAQAARNAKHYEMHGAVLRALDVIDAAIRWARGEEVFAGCRLADEKT